MNVNNTIIIIEASQIVAEGLVGIINKFGRKYYISVVDSLDEMQLKNAKTKADIIIINPSYIYNSKIISTFRNEYVNAKIVGLVYAYHDPKILSSFDALINISNGAESISTLLIKLLSEDNRQAQVSSQDLLSEREIDVLKLLVTGNANKEIADKLNISTNTVISHRKNISQKIGIKSVSGLTIYAVVNNIISIDNFV